MTREEQIMSTEDYVRVKTTGAESGHDWWHINRVRNLALYINDKEHLADPFILEIASLLHDVADFKFAGHDQSSVFTEIGNFMEATGIGEIKRLVIEVIGNVSFSKKDKKGDLNNPLLLVLQDADRLDAIGAIGIARAFNYGGFSNRSIFDPDEPTEDEGVSTIAHFYNKLLKLKDLMHTETAKKIAQQRHLFLEQYLDQFYNEWNMTLGR